MTDDTFRAYVLHQEGEGVRGGIERVTGDRLPEGDTLVAVSHTTLNYKDGMVLRGLGRLVRTYPHVPGIDFAGTVVESSGGLAPGQEVILTGWRVGETRWGGYAERARVKAGWLVPMPPGLTPARAMAVGTAGLTAMLAVQALERHGLQPGGEVLVTGAAGGVGSMAVAMLSRLGYQVAASTGRAAEAEYLRGLGADTIVSREELEAAGARPLQSERYAAVVDAVGGRVLAGALPHLRYGGAAAACGLAGGADLHTTVVPFLLRGVSLLGIDSVMQPFEARVAAWARIADVLPGEVLDRMTQKAGLEEVDGLAGEILAGKVRGRVVVGLEGLVLTIA